MRSFFGIWSIFMTAGEFGGGLRLGTEKLAD